METKNDGVFERLNVLFLWSVFMLIIFLVYLNTKIETIHENQRDINERITAIEQSQTITDQAVIDALQKSNECMFELNR